MKKEEKTATIKEILEQAGATEDQTLILRSRSGRKQEEFRVGDLTPQMKKTKCTYARLHAGGVKHGYNAIFAISAK